MISTKVSCTVENDQSHNSFQSSVTFMRHMQTGHALIRNRNPKIGNGFVLLLRIDKSIQLKWLNFKPLIMTAADDIFFTATSLISLLLLKEWEIRFTDRYKTVLLLWIICVISVLCFYAFASVHCWLVVTCWERADLLALVCDV